MANKFIEKHKRKSLLAMLLLLFQGRTRYLVLLLLLVSTSVPFVISGDMAGRFLGIPMVSSMLRMLGLGSVVSSLDPKYSGEFVKAAMARAAADGAQNSYWNSLVGAVGSMLPGGGSGGSGGSGGNSSLAMIKGGADLFQPDADGKAGGKNRAGQVTGAVSAEDAAGGGGADTVDLEGLLNDSAGGGAGGGSGLYGDLMGANLADRYSASGGGAGGGGSYGGGGSGSGPYANKSLLSQPGGSAGRKDGMYANAIKQSGGKVPVPGNPKKVSTKKMGRVSGFTWKNVGYKTTYAKKSVGLSSQRPMFQLTETFGMTGGALTSNTPEYQAAYTGTTYDGNNVNLGVIQTDVNAPQLPDIGFIDERIKKVEEIEKMSRGCVAAEAVNGKKMSDDAAAIDSIRKGMSSPPDCYTSGVSAWNAKVRRLGLLCQDFNAQSALLAGRCQATHRPMGCSLYSSYADKGSTGMLIRYCPKPTCSHCHGKKCLGCGCCIIWYIFWLLVAALALAIAIVMGPLIAAVFALAVIAAALLLTVNTGTGDEGAEAYTGVAASYQEGKMFDKDGKPIDFRLPETAPQAPASEDSVAARQGEFIDAGKEVIEAKDKYEAQQAIVDKLDKVLINADSKDKPAFESMLKSEMAKRDALFAELETKREAYAAAEQAYTNEQAALKDAKLSAKPPAKTSATTPETAPAKTDGGVVSWLKDLFGGGKSGDEPVETTGPPQTVAALETSVATKREVVVNAETDYLAAKDMIAAQEQVVKNLDELRAEAKARGETGNESEEAAQQWLAKEAMVTNEKLKLEAMKTDLELKREDMDVAEADYNSELTALRDAKASEKAITEMTVQFQKNQPTYGADRVRSQ